MDGAQIAAIIEAHGIAILAPLAVIEGPIVTVIAAYLSSLGLLDVIQVYLCVVIADVVGDCILYGLGRAGSGAVPPRLGLRLGLNRRRMAGLIRAYRDNGVRLLILGKLTHAAGFAVLVAAGAARMNILTFIAANLVGTIPKSLALVTLGYLFGSAHAVIAAWFSTGSAVLLALIVAAAGGWWLWRRGRQA
jgi:membrane protein DedA with SNARE-associated domain